MSTGPGPTGGEIPPPWRGVTLALLACAVVVSVVLGFAGLGCIAENRDHYPAICTPSPLGNDAFTAAVLGGPVLIGVAGAISVARDNGVWLAGGCAIAAVGYLLAIVLGLG